MHLRSNRLADLVEKVHNELERLLTYDHYTAELEKGVASVEQHKRNHSRTEATRQTGFARSHEKAH